MSGLTFHGYAAEINGEIDKDSFARNEDEVAVWIWTSIKIKQWRHGVKVRIVKVLVNGTVLPGDK